MSVTNESNRFNGQVALVTGATAGIGEAASLAYAKEGQKLYWLEETLNGAIMLLAKYKIMVVINDASVPGTFPILPMPKKVIIL